ncbi:PHB depolymerase family esterase [Marinibactrum halimedae]|uniref:Depolymerase n=1 Tax=Marinibactrum halimedae TaxID=1444977 RepID=A0AA37TAX6_9GAMM|nr:PHB depolymerase family esterase [Marinibactrum halimedae]MCD9457630.1 PHB depolymerase family esterase [Marinibactrum halimedae]GLS28052.1 depolymerase [Marinibactrum halimedae]
MDSFSKLLRRVSRSAVIVLPFLVSTHTAIAADKLPALGVNLENTSVSGLSSGAFMTSQFYVVNSDIMVGAGVIAGGPYLCAQSYAYQSYMVNATTACMNPLTASVGPNTQMLVSKTKKLSKEKKIDNIDNIKDDKIYIFSGKADHVVATKVVDQTEKFFLDLGVDADSILYNTNVDAGHAIITNNKKDTECDLTKAPFINDCDFEQSHRIIRHIYGDTKPPSEKATGKIIKFDQLEFVDSEYTSMSKHAYAYVPDQCYSQSCNLHVVFHGCLQGADVIGDQYYAGTGYNEIADTNNLVMLYPQVHPSKGKPLNPQGCWDFWGYSLPEESQPDYFTKEAPQIKAVTKMVKRLAQQNVAAQ